MGGAIYKGVTYPVRPVEVVDSSGAGDAFMASLVCNFLKTKDIEQSISAANEAASKVVAKRGVSLIES
jgi:sugar/nucleoside kinase (ribokinase family)